MHTLPALCESTFRESCALHEWPECESRTAEIWGAMIGQYGPFVSFDTKG
jgi:hypothetical protein